MDLKLLYIRGNMLFDLRVIHLVPAEINNVIRDLVDHGLKGLLHVNIALGDIDGGSQVHYRFNGNGLVLGNDPE
jgi:hypothetical protein